MERTPLRAVPHLLLRVVFDLSRARSTLLWSSISAAADSRQLKMPPCYSVSRPDTPWGTSAFCPMWPLSASNLSESNMNTLRDAAMHWLEPFKHDGITRETLQAAEQRRCVQRLCMRIQIIRSRMYDVFVVSLLTQNSHHGFGEWHPQEHP